MPETQAEATSQTQEDAIEIAFAFSSANVALLATRLWLQSINQHLLWILVPALTLGISLSPNYAGQVLREEDTARGFLWGVLTLASFQLAQSYFLTLKRWLKGSNKQMKYRFDENGVRFQSESGSGSWGWESFSTLWKRSDVWLLYTADFPDVILPAPGLTEHLKTYIARKVAEAGGRVV